MKHFLKKKSFQGAGWFSKPKQPKPQPSILRPPNLGKYKTLQSYSVMEIIDLISDGPIEGLVNQNGQLLNNSNILQGIYLDNTPVQSTLSASFIEAQNYIGVYSINQPLNYLGDVFAENAFVFKNLYFSLHYGAMNPAYAWPFVNFTTQRLLFYDEAYDEFGGKTRKRWWKKKKKDPPEDWVNYKHYLADNTNIKFQQIALVLAAAWSKKRGFRPKINPSFSRIDNNYLQDSGWEFGATAIYHNSGQMRICFAGSVDSIDIVNTAYTDISRGLTNINISEYEKKFLNENKAKLDQLIPRSESNMKYFGEVSTYAYVVCSVGSFQSPIILDGAKGKSIFKIDEKTQQLIKNQMDDFFFEIPSMGEFGDSTQYIITPRIAADGTLTGEFYGCIVWELPLVYQQEKVHNGLGGKNQQHIYAWKWYLGVEVGKFAAKKAFLRFVRGVSPYTNAITKYNFNNLSAQFKIGDESQEPLQGFERIYIDYDYDSSLYGPFNLYRNIERLGPIGDSDVIYPPLIGSTEGSVDARSSRNYSNWNDVNSLNETAVPFTHTIENPNVEAVFFTLAVQQLSDTIDIDEGTNEWDRKIGEKRPATVTIEVQVGITRNGSTSTITKKRYSIIALVEGIMLIDFGCPELSRAGRFYSSIRDVTSENKECDLSIPFELPKIDVNEDTSKTKRFIKIIKLSGETNSVLIKKELSVKKVTEIIHNKLSYPFSSLVGIKIDSRSFQSTPDRTYDCRLKKIKIPTNYYPLNESKFGIDKRYIQDKSNYYNDTLIYEGDWDGNFKIGWTDNPAWIIYDLLTNTRYGLGRYLDESQVNKWELYKIGRFCDAVDENGYFIGVSDGFYGLEPRYSCNVIFKEESKIYDTLVSIANLFRGFIYFYNSEINFLDDRPRIPLMTFSNTQVKDGVFNYSNIRKDQQYNTIEVAYLDRFDNYKSKIEYVEDEQDIRKRGVFKSRIESFGVTSKAMARRMGQHMIYQTIKENQSVEFTAGLEALLCRPGDLIIVEDDLKTRAKNFGRILEIDIDKKTLLLENEYIQAQYDGTITVYTPTGNATLEDLTNLSIQSRSRLEYFDVTGNLIDNNDSILIGRYYFDSYKQYVDEAKSFFPLYTGQAAAGHKIFCYYNTGVDSFVFSTGLAYQDNNTYDKVITNTGIYQISKIIASSGQSGDAYDSERNIYRYNASNPNKTGVQSFSYEKLYKKQANEYFGILESEINTVNNPQITKFYITGFDNTLEYGCKVYLDQTKPNTNFIIAAKEGSPYRLGRLNAQDQIYKILAIREENQNEYSIAASKYDTGKFVQIENFAAEDFLPDTYYSGSSNVGNVVVEQLMPPTITQFTTGSLTPNGYSIKASWMPVEGTEKYEYSIYNEILNIAYISEISGTSVILDNIKDLGDWKLNVRSIAESVGKINSELSTTGQFVAYYASAIMPLKKAAVLNFTVT